MEEKKYPKRGKCPCGGYYQDWHSHASECIVINKDGHDFSKTEEDSKDKK